MSSTPLTAREAYQWLREIALGVRTLRRLGEKPWTEMYCGMMTVEVHGWIITLYNDCVTLDYFDNCFSPDSRAYIHPTTQVTS